MFAFIQGYIAEHRRAPLIREIQLGCQIASYKSAIDRLSALEHKGFIRRIPNKHRGIKLVHRAGLGLGLDRPPVAGDGQGQVAEASPFQEEPV